MGISREVSIEFGGEVYRFVPSNKLLRRVDAELAPQTLFGVLSTMDGREAPLPALALIISMFLNEGGGDFTEDDILVELYRDVRENNGQGILPLMEMIAEVLAGPGGDMGNSPSPAPSSEKPGGGRGKKAKQKQKEKAH